MQLDFIIEDANFSLKKAWQDHCIPIGNDHRCVHCILSRKESYKQEYRRKHVLKGWRPFFDESGQPTSFQILLETKTGDCDSDRRQSQHQRTTSAASQYTKQRTHESRMTSPRRPQTMRVPAPKRSAGPPKSRAHHTNRDQQRIQPAMGRAKGPPMPLPAPSTPDEPSHTPPPLLTGPRFARRKGNTECQRK